MSSCFVPNCNNTLGEQIPKDNRRKVWLERLKFGYVPPDAIICYGHLKCYKLLPTTVISDQSDTNFEVIENSSDDFSDAKWMCRICMSPKNLVRRITDPLEGETLIMSVIMLTCYPVKYSADDSLPKYICSVCFNDLKIAHKLRLRCLDSVKKIPHRMEAIHESKRKNLEQLNKGKKLKVAKDIKVEESIENIKKEINSDKLEVHKTIDKYNFDHFKNIVGDINVSTSDLMNTLSKNNGSTVDSNFLSNVVLPKSIKLKALVKYQSEIGIFPCTLVYGILDSIFIKSQDFIYAYGLVKKDLKNLHCIVPSCKALATQKLLGLDAYEASITVKIPHNHIAPNDNEQKRQMFHVNLKKRTYLDKNINIRSVYDEFCNLEPSLRDLIPLRQVISQYCKHKVKVPNVKSFQHLYDDIEENFYQNIQFTLSGEQFYQEKFETDDGGLAIVFCNTDIAVQLSDSLLMYVDASFKIDIIEDFTFHLVTVLVWIEESYYPILYALVNKNSRDLYKCIFLHLHDYCAPKLRPEEIVTDYDANLYYALGDTYLCAHIGGSVFYYTQNMYQKVCSLNLSRDLETNAYFRNIYHMLLMLPLLPENTIMDGLHNIEVKASESGLAELAKPLFDHVRTQWITNVTPELFCVHRLENRINENVIAPFKKLRDLLIISKGKTNKCNMNIMQVVEKIVELETFLNFLYSKENKKSFGRDMSCLQKRNVIKAWQYIDDHPKINVNDFFTKVLGYIKCMENQLWIWGFYRFIGNVNNELINATNFSIINMPYEGDSECEEYDELINEESKIPKFKRNIYSPNDLFTCVGDEETVENMLEILNDGEDSDKDIFKSNVHIHNLLKVRENEDIENLDEAEENIDENKSTENDDYLLDDNIIEEIKDGEALDSVPAVILEAVVDKHGKVIMTEH